MSGSSRRASGSRPLIDVLTSLLLAWAEQDKFALDHRNGKRPAKELEERAHCVEEKKADLRALLETIPEVHAGTLLGELEQELDLMRPGSGKSQRRVGTPRGARGLAHALVSRAREGGASAPQEHRTAPAKQVRYDPSTRPRRALAELERVAKKPERPEGAAPEEPRRDPKKRAEAERRREKAKRDFWAAQDREKERSLATARREITRLMERDYLGAVERLNQLVTDKDITGEEADLWRTEFVQGWAVRTLDEVLDASQALAVGALETDLLITARAGSGKTRVLVSRALFLQLHCGVAPSEILVLAFNRDAAKEVSERLKDRLGETPLPHVMTFHALAYAIARPTGTLLHDDGETGAKALTDRIGRIAQNIVNAQEGIFRESTLAYLSAEWHQDLRVRELVSMPELARRLDAASRETLQGEWVKSYGEHLIANALFENDVSYVYEENFNDGGFNYRPDFTIKVNGQRRAVIEYFGLGGDREYDRVTQRKVEFWTRHHSIALIRVDPFDVAGDAGLAAARVIGKVRALGIPIRPLSSEEVWRRVKPRATTRFANSASGWVERAKVANLSPNELRTTLARSRFNASLSNLLELLTCVYENYIEVSDREQFTDFASLVWEGSARLGTSGTKFNRRAGQEIGDLSRIRFIQIDEFQDVSRSFMALVESIRDQTQDAKIAAVGDDWQAINEFAGADRTYFATFDSHFPGARRITLQVNHRSSVKVVEAGNLIMRGRGAPAIGSSQEPGRAYLVDHQALTPTGPESKAFPDTETATVARLVKRALEKGPAVRIAILLRTRAAPRTGNTLSGRHVGSLNAYRDLVLSHVDKTDRLRVEVSTTHRFKGREADYIVIPDATQDRYPLIHPTWPINLVFGETLADIIEAERRLFYVAASRARVGVFFLSTPGRSTEFLPPDLAPLDPNRLAPADNTPPP